MSAVDMFWAAPPVTRAMTATIVLISLAVHLGPVDPYYVVWLSYKVFTYKTLPEIWRLVTPFLLTGPKLGLLMDPIFFYQYANQLESGSAQFSEPGSFVTYIIFMGAFIILTNGCLLGGFSFLSALSLGLAYTYAQENPNAMVSYIVITFSAKYLPYAMLAVSFLLNGPLAVMYEITGLFAAHAYLFLSTIWPRYGGGTELIRTPAVIKRFFERADGERPRAYGTGTAADRGQTAGQNQTGRGGGWTSGSSTAGGAVRSAWSSRGPGQRLGGD